MKLKPVILFKFPDTSFRVTEEFIVKDSLEFSYKLMKDLKPSSNMISFILTKKCSNIIERLINTKSDVRAEVSIQTGTTITRLFTGNVSSKYNWTIDDNGESAFKVTVEDMGLSLLKKIYNKDTDEVLKGTMTEVLTKLCDAAGIVRADDIVVPTKVFLNAKKNSKYEDLLKGLVSECLYTYYFDEYGRLALRSLPSIAETESKTDYIINDTNLFEKNGKAINVKKSIQQYGKVEVAYTTYEEVEKASIYRDISGADEKHLNCNIKIPSKGFYPNKDGTISYVEVTDLDSGREVVYLYPDSIEPLVTGDVDFQMVAHGAKSIGVVLANNSPVDQYVTQLGARGKIIVEASKDFARSGADGELKEIKSEWLHDENSNGEYAKYLANYYKHCGTEYSFFSNADMILGNICRLQDNTYSGLNTRVLLTGKKYILNGLYEYTAVGITAFDINTYEVGGVNNPSTYPGRPGVGIVGIDYYYAVHNSNINPPIEWVPDNPPEFTIENRYLWSYFVTRYSNGNNIESTPGVVGVLGVDGQSPVVVTPSFTSYTYPANGDGIIAPADFSAMQCAVEVKQDISTFKAVAGPPLQNEEYYIRTTQIGVTNVETTYSTIKTTEASSMPNDTATINAVVTYKNAKGVEQTTGFVINLTKVKDGKDGQYTAYSYAVNTSSEIAPTEGWTETIPALGEDQYLWYRTQVVPSGGTIIESNWSVPLLSGGNITKVYKDLKIMGDSIAFEVLPNGDVKSSAGLILGHVDGKGYIILDADKVIAPKGIDASKIDTDSIFANEIKVGKSIYAGGYDGSGKSDGTQGFYLDSNGKLLAVTASLNNTTVNGTFDCSDNKGTVFKTQQGSDVTVDVACSPADKWSTDDLFANVSAGSSGTCTYKGTNYNYKRPTSGNMLQFGKWRGYASFGQNAYIELENYRIPASGYYEFHVWDEHGYIESCKRRFFVRKGNGSGPYVISENLSWYKNASYTFTPWLNEGDNLYIYYETNTGWNEWTNQYMTISYQGNSNILYWGDTLSINNAGTFYSDTLIHKNNTLQMGSFNSNNYLKYAPLTGWLNGLPEYDVPYGVKPGTYCTVKGSREEVVAVKKQKLASSGYRDSITLGINGKSDVTMYTPYDYEIAGTLKLINEERGNITATLLPSNGESTVGTASNYFSRGYITNMSGNLNYPGTTYKVYGAVVN